MLKVQYTDQPSICKGNVGLLGLFRDKDWGI
jgi:hypothetical protein